MKFLFLIIILFSTSVTLAQQGGFLGKIQSDDVNYKLASVTVDYYKANGADSISEINCFYYNYDSIDSVIRSNGFKKYVEYNENGHWIYSKIIHGNYTNEKRREIIIDSSSYSVTIVYLGNNDSIIQRYNPEWKLIEIKRKNWSELYYYDENGELFSRLEYENNKVVYSEFYHRKNPSVSNHLVVKESCGFYFDQFSNLCESESLLYDSNQLLKYRVVFDKNNNILYEQKYKYNNKGSLTLVKHKSAVSSYTEKYKYEYDDSNKLISEHHFINKNLHYIKKYLYL